MSSGWQLVIFHTDNEALIPIHFRFKKKGYAWRIIRPKTARIGCELMGIIDETLNL